jgi:hypothetical protein
MGGIITFRAYDYDTVHNHSGGRRNGKKKTTNLHLRPLSSPQRQVPNEITIDQSMEDEDIGETTT